MSEDASTFKYLSMTLLIILSILTIIGNSTCIFVINRTKELSRTPSSYLIRNLLIVHFLQGLIVFPLYAAKKHGVESLLWHQMICDGFRLTFMITFYMAVFSVFLIAMDRFIAVIFAMRYREIVTKRRVIFCIIGIWMYITSLCLIPFKYPDGHPRMEGFFYTNNPNNTSNISMAINATMPRKPIVKCKYNQSKLWTILMLAFNCLLPYITIVGIYQFIIFQISKSERKTKDKKSSTQSSEESKYKIKEISKFRKITTVSLILSIAYLVTWSPSVFYYVLWSVCPNVCFSEGYKHSNIETYIGFFTKYLAFLDAIASPIIYCLFSERFRYFVPRLKEKKKNHLDLANVDLLKSYNTSHFSVSSERIQTSTDIC